MLGVLEKCSGSSWKGHQWNRLFTKSVSGAAAGLLLQNHIRAVCRVQNSNCRASTAHFPNQSTFRDLHFLSCSSPVVPEAASEEGIKERTTAIARSRPLLRDLVRNLVMPRTEWGGSAEVGHDLLYDLLRDQHVAFTIGFTKESVSM